MSQHSSRGDSWERTRQQVIERDGPYCADCLKGELIGRDLTVDHIVSKSAGGSDDLYNLRVLCRSCNATKSDHELIRIAYFDRDWIRTPLI